MTVKTIIICDRCSRQVEYKKTIKDILFNWGIEPYSSREYLSVINGWSEVHGSELCPKCTEEYKKYSKKFK